MLNLIRFLTCCMVFGSFTGASPAYSDEVASKASPAIGKTISEYVFTNDPIDVVITSTDKDKDTLDLCIEGIRENGRNVGRIFVVSEKPLTELAEWFDSGKYPFTKYEVSLGINGGDAELAKADLSDHYSNVEFYYHQLLRFYAGLVIPNLSSNYLVVDPDTIFLNPVEFQNETLAGIYNAEARPCKECIAHARRVIPSFQRAYYLYSGQVKHMLFQKCILDDLFNGVEKHHKTDFWKVYCDKIDNTVVNGEGASEYEIYFQYVFSKSKQVKIRRLKSLDVMDISAAKPLKEYGYDYITCRAWRREWLADQVSKSTDQINLFEVTPSNSQDQTIQKSIPKKIKAF